jgi:hypothetical protein
MHRPEDEPSRDESSGRPLPCLEDTLTAAVLDPWVAPYHACPEGSLPLTDYCHNHNT